MTSKMQRDDQARGITGKACRSFAKIGLAVSAAVVLMTSNATAQDIPISATLKAIKDRGVLKCQVGSPTPGFFSVDSGGVWSGFFVDQCRALAIAIFDDADKVDFVTVPTSSRFTTLTSGETDLINDGATWTATRDTQLGVSFPLVTFYDGQGFMVKADNGVKTAADLKGATICLQSGGATTQQNVTDFFTKLGITYTPVTTDTSTVMAETYLNGGCDAMVNDKSSLVGRKASFADPAAHAILPETISKEPLGPMVRAADPQWAALVRWVSIGLIAAEELNVTSKNIEAMKKSENPQIGRLLGVGSSIGSGLGLTDDFMARVIAKLGNYGEIYDRNLGPSTPVNLPRAGSLNDLWTKGGLLYAYPFS